MGFAQKHMIVLNVSVTGVSKSLLTLYPYDPLQRIKAHSLFRMAGSNNNEKSNNSNYCKRAPTFSDSAPAFRDMRLIKHQKKPSREQSFMITEQERLSLNLSEIPLAIAMSFIYLCSFEQQ